MREHPSSAVYMESKIGILSLNPCIDKTVYVEKFMPHGLNRTIRSRRDPGGKGLNVARILSNFGMKPAVLGFIASRGGDFLRDWLSKDGIEYNFQEIDADTRVNLKVVDESTGRTTEINELGFHIPLDSLKTFRDNLFSLIEKMNILILSGRLPPGVPEDFYARCIEFAKGKGVLTVLDTDGAALSAGLRQAPYAVKPNLEELESLFKERFPTVRDVAMAARRLIGRGVETVIVSMGKDGAVVADKNNTYKTGVWPVDVKSTVGAGDSMVGALVYGIFKRMNTADIARLATAAGTIAATKEGTEFCTLPEALCAAEKVSLSPVVL